MKALQLSIYQWKNLLIDFIIELLVSTNEKIDNNNFILIIVNKIMKIVYYELVKVIIDALKLAKVIFDVIV